MDDLLFPLEEIPVNLDVKIQEIPEKEWGNFKEDLHHYAADDEIQYYPPEASLTGADF